MFGDVSYVDSYRPLDWVPPPGNWDQSELFIIAEVEGDVEQQHRPFRGLEMKLLDAGVHCHMKIYTPEQWRSVRMRFHKLPL